MIRKLLLSSFIFIFLSSSYAQDILILRNGNKEKVKVLQVNSSQIIYQSYNDQLIIEDSTIQIIRKKEIDTIKYEDGYKEIYNINLRKYRPFGIHATINGPSSIGTIALGSSYFIKPCFAIEGGINTKSAYIGFRYHALGNRIRYWTPYIGAYGNYSFNKIVTMLAYIPIGVHYISDSGFMFAPDIGLVTFYTNEQYRMWLGVGMKIGYQFAR